MDNQHQKITGYRDLTQGEIDLMNKIKAIGEEVGALVKHMDDQQSPADGAFFPDKRHLAIARTHLETGFMFLVKSVAKPTTTF